MTTEATCLLLPGLDGTGKLFERFVAARPAASTVTICPLPTDGTQSYSELARRMATQLPDSPIVLIAESFSGPLAVLLAQAHANVAAVVLCASFVKPPLLRALSRLPQRLWTRPAPESAIRFFLTGGEADLAHAVRDALRDVPGRVVSARIATALRTDVSSNLRALTQPVLYLHAAQDRIVGARSAKWLKKVKPSAVVVPMRGPHLLLQARPAEAWSHIVSFLGAAKVDTSGVF